MLTNDAGQLTGIFTDSDLARLLEHNRDAAIDGPIAAVMTAAPKCVKLGAALGEAFDIFSARKISELPVVDKMGQPQGLIDITDVVGLLPREAASES
jgi:arabinose-5-phosphate isomerase